MKNHHGCHGHQHEAGPTLETALDRLKTSGLKLTGPRRALLEAIAASPAPFTTDQIFQTVKKSHRDAKCDLVTVYRSLATFADLKILSKVDLGDGIVRYEWADPQGHHHHHFVCNACGRIEPLNLCEIETQEKALRAAGYAQLTHRLEFFGICPACASPRKGKAASQN